jgi:hypothetical protein
VKIPDKFLIKSDLPKILQRCLPPEFFLPNQFPRRIYIPEEILLTPVIMNASQHNLTLGKDYEILVFSQGILIPPQPGLIMMHQPMDKFRSQVEKFIEHINCDNKERFQVRLKTDLYCSL